MQHRPIGKPLFIRCMPQPTIVIWKLPPLCYVRLPAATLPSVCRFIFCSLGSLHCPILRHQYCLLRSRPHSMHEMSFHDGRAHAPNRPRPPPSRALPRSWFTPTGIGKSTFRLDKKLFSPYTGHSRVATQMNDVANKIAMLNFPTFFTFLTISIVHAVLLKPYHTAEALPT